MKEGKFDFQPIGCVYLFICPISFDGGKKTTAKTTQF